MTMIGIDLGTSNSLVSYWNDGKAELIPNVFGEVLTPSVVGIDDNGELLVGKIAKERLTTHPNKTVAAFKRNMGTAKKYNLGEHTFNSSDLSACILKSLKADAEKFLGRTCEKAVISIPAYFNNMQRQATLEAAYLAGLQVDSLINEPTAAAIAYGIHEKEADTIFAVLDLGGGTFDVSILEMFNGIMQVIAISGNNYLGGEDFTNVIMKYFLNKLELRETSLTLEERAQLVKQAEICKIAIGEQDEINSQITIAGEERNIVLTAADFELISKPLLSKMRIPIIQALKDAKLKPVDLEQIILIGGATKMPIIRSFSSRFLGKIPFISINPDETVARGAAVQSALKEKHFELADFMMTDVCSHSLGVEVAREIGKEEYVEGNFLPIIERNTTVPVSRTKQFATVYDFQESVRATIYQGESRHVNENLELGSIAIPVPPEKAGYPVNVQFTYDKNGLLEVLVSLPLTGETKQLIIQNGISNLSNEELEAQLNRLKEIKIHPRDRAENRLLLAKADRIYRTLLDDDREQLEKEINVFEKVLSKQVDYDVKHARKRLELILENIERKSFW
ncbi:molecular chaperone HscC [Listeria cossartiae subsp. cayugensis]|uniref:molecular chaperone HscC n=1 Tax=Listeria TaxID=1637 RepID=UPI001E485D37|nr:MULTISPECIES: molecular chaperone HscC [Listeria]MCD2252418.1 molecular chaperone HscC [Listeria marthii]MDT0002028.1 molecular chaperone HscC [Listeria cossartiae subsp. cayugensis]MDT0019603.1 molecular chaperone HscC [Listeria cossartiae subsp. cayugensis]MDT0034823.1 molecular chaperone HscC [Listeria cossartiae subsp. cayugensis]MDT0041354.1 molecular chaperone HscC [Listeria cossartiae subsp. cayugensis]